MGHRKNTLFFQYHSCSFRRTATAMRTASAVSPVSERVRFTSSANTLAPRVPAAQCTSGKVRWWSCIS